MDVIYKNKSGPDIDPFWIPVFNFWREDSAEPFSCWILVLSCYGTILNVWLKSLYPKPCIPKLFNLPLIYIDYKSKVILRSSTISIVIPIFDFINYINLIN